MSRLADQFQGAYQRLVAELRDAGPYGQSSGVGDRRERALKDFLLRFLPSSIRLARGRVVDSFGAVSAEFDIVVYADGYCPTWAPAGEDDRLLIPIEAVLATIEVKSQLTKDEIEKAGRAFSGLQRLRRCYRPTSVNRAFDQLMQRKEDVDDPYREAVAADRSFRGVPSVAGALVSLDGLAAETAVKHLAGTPRELSLSWNIQRGEVIVDGSIVRRHGAGAALLTVGGWLQTVTEHAQDLLLNVQPRLDGYWSFIAREERPESVDTTS